MTPEQIAEARRLADALRRWSEFQREIDAPTPTLEEAAALLRTLADAADGAAQEPVGVVGMSAPDQRMLYSLKAVEVVDVPSAPTAFLFKPLPVGTKLYAASPAQPLNALLEWACIRWREEVQHRPLINNNRRPLDDAWRQVIRFAGGDPDELIGPSHDTLLLAEADRRLNGLEQSAQPLTTDLANSIRAATADLARLRTERQADAEVIGSMIVTLQRVAGDRAGDWGRDDVQRCISELRGMLERHDVGGEAHAPR